MSSFTRRDLCTLLAALPTMSGTALVAQATTATADSKLTHSIGYRFESLPVTHQEGGGEIRNILHGTLPTGEMVDIHETSLPPGKIPHAPHRHLHSEFTLVREGTLEFYNDGKPEIVGAGGDIFAASGVLHGWKNVGITPATYFVFAIGDSKL